LIGGKELGHEKKRDLTEEKRIEKREKKGEIQS